ncbi:energy transducer TonB [Mesonia maritima]|uniref:Protein TonB n=1 Tax=Mesonia maritima TaxID=1793873 RepID=A0ABU1K4I9_9FLAO|nr:energy transducer TonB [Mesonia maritima]MDR6300175.1 protein TonB [Mesonia maritima]
MKSQEQKPQVKTKFIYFQLGLIVALLCSIFLIEHKTTVKEKEKPVIIYQASLMEKTPIYKVKTETPEPIKKQKASSQKSKNNDELKIIDNKDFLKSLFNNEAKIDDGKVDEDLGKKLEEPTTIIEDNIPINYLKVEEAPIFPGCEKYDSKAERSSCFSSQIAKLVQRKFDSSIGQELGLSGEQRIYVTFTVDEKGKVVDIKAVSKVDALAKEAERVTKLLPTMKPGKQQGKNVPVTYALPITFNLQ